MLEKDILKLEKYNKIKILTDIVSDTSINATDSSIVNMEQILVDSSVLINGATTVGDVDNRFITATENLYNAYIFDIDKQLLIEYKDKIITNVDFFTYYLTQLVSVDDSFILNKLFNKYISLVDDATTFEEVDLIYIEWYNEFISLDAMLDYDIFNQLKQNILIQLEAEYLNISIDLFEYQDNFLETYQNYVTLISSENNVITMFELKLECEEYFLEVERADALLLLNNIYNETKAITTDMELLSLDDLYNSYYDKITLGLAEPYDLYREFGNKCIELPTDNLKYARIDAIKTFQYDFDQLIKYATDSSIVSMQNVYDSFILEVDLASYSTDISNILDISTISLNNEFILDANKQTLEEYRYYTLDSMTFYIDDISNHLVNIYQYIYLYQIIPYSEIEYATSIAELDSIYNSWYDKVVELDLKISFDIDDNYVTTITDNLVADYYSALTNVYDIIYRHYEGFHGYVLYDLNYQLSFLDNETEFLNYISLMENADDINELFLYRSKCNTIIGKSVIADFKGYNYWVIQEGYEFYSKVIIEGELVKLNNLVKYSSNMIEVSYDERVLLAGDIFRSESSAILTDSIKLLRYNNTEDLLDNFNNYSKTATDQSIIDINTIYNVCVDNMNISESSLEIDDLYQDALTNMSLAYVQSNTMYGLEENRQSAIDKLEGYYHSVYIYAAYRDYTAHIRFDLILNEYRKLLNAASSYSEIETILNIAYNEIKEVQLEFPQYNLLNFKYDIQSRSFYAYNDNVLYLSEIPIEVYQLYLEMLNYINITEDPRLIYDRFVEYNNNIQSTVFGLYKIETLNTINSKHEYYSLVIVDNELVNLETEYQAILTLVNESVNKVLIEDSLFEFINFCTTSTVDSLKFDKYNALVDLKVHYDYHVARATDASIIIMDIEYSFYSETIQQSLTSAHVSSNYLQGFDAIALEYVEDPVKSELVELKIEKIACINHFYQITKDLAHYGLDQFLLKDLVSESIIMVESTTTVEELNLLYPILYEDLVNFPLDLGDVTNFKTATLYTMQSAYYDATPSTEVTNLFNTYYMLVSNETIPYVMELLKNEFLVALDILLLGT